MISMTKEDAGVILIYLSCVHLAAFDLYSLDT